MSKNRAGLSVGAFLALFHAVWSLLVAVIPGQLQGFMNWIFALHHIDMPFRVVTPFVMINAIQLLIFTFIFGYIIGWVFVWVVRMVGKRR